MTFPDVRDGQWVRPVREGYLMECCDCGLVHKIDFRVVRWTGEGIRRRPLKSRDFRRYTVELRANRVWNTR